MAKTEVILTQHIIGLGGESDQVKVAAGYARNYLYPQGFAIPVSDGNKRRLEALRQRRAEREAHEFNTMSELSKSITKLTCVLKVKTGDDGKMFGSITSGAIADELKHQFDITLEKRKIHLEHPIKALGEFEIELRLHSDVKATLKVKVESANPLPAAAAEADSRTDERGDGQHREKRSVRHGAQAKTEAPVAEGARGDRRPRPAAAAARTDKPAAKAERPPAKQEKPAKGS
ncbi:MAG: large subunit ribosomal protein [Verrucomicrobiota bacterium]|jgi:large subunit ribosomal protein L9